MNRFRFALLATALVTVGVGCSMPRSPFQGGLYTDVKDGLAVNNGPIGTLSGSAEARTIIGITTGDCSISAAAAKGNIKEISHVDYHSWGIMGIYGTTTTTVYGK